MESINELIFISEKTRECYLQLITNEIEGNVLQMEALKKVIFYLTQKENQILEHIFQTKEAIENLNQFLVNESSYNESFYDKIFQASINSEIHPLVIERLTAKYSAKLARIKEEFLDQLVDLNQLEELGLEKKKNPNLKYINAVTWNLSYFMKAVSAKLEFATLLDQIKENQYSEKVGNKLIYYKNLFIFSNPYLEKHFIFQEELSSHIPLFLFPNYNASEFYQKIHHYTVYLPIMEGIENQLENILNESFINSLCEDSALIMNTIYFSSLISLLYFLEDNNYFSLKQNIYEQLNHLMTTVGYQQFLKTKLQFEYAFEKREKKKIKH